MEILHTAPSESQFTPLSTHQSQTPTSFYSDPPVLHHLSPSSTLIIQSTDLHNAPVFSALASHSKQQINGSAPPSTDDDPDDESHEIRIEDVDIWVTSDTFLLYSTTLTTGISIPYPSISLHAIQRSPTPSLLLQLLTTTGQQFDDHDPSSTISLSIIPTQTPSEGAAPTEPDTTSPPTDPLTLLFSALTACADLHPDAASTSDIDIDDDDNTGGLSTETAAYTQIDGLPPPMPGSGGWITAENVGEFFDGEGNWRGRLGEGAGIVRGREEEEGGGEVDGDGEGGGGGDGEETKWRRTG
ncbi:MAG: hypothetical protein Q9219_006718 [cf. Caloplaca sp. 3 TL-2023]